MAEGWKTVDIQERSRLVGGRFQDVYEVTFQTDHGYTGSVQVPASQINDDAAVKALIDERVAAIDALHNL